MNIELHFSGFLLKNLLLLERLYLKSENLKTK